MTAPASFNTSERIITYAMKDAGLLDRAQTPDSDELAENQNRLNDIVNILITEGIKLWLWQDINIPLVAGQPTYNIGPAGNVVMTKPLRGIYGYYNDTTNTLYPVQTPLTPLSWTDYSALSSRGGSNVGSITNYFVDKQQTQLAISFWMAPSTIAATNGSCHMVFETQVQNTISLTDTVYFPTEWFIALRWLLADDISTGQPSEIIQRCAQNAAKYKMILEGWDVEDAPVTLQPNLQGMQSRFNR